MKAKLLNCFLALLVAVICSSFVSCSKKKSVEDLLTGEWKGVWPIGTFVKDGHSLNFNKMEETIIFGKNHSLYITRAVYPSDYQTAHPITLNYEGTYSNNNGTLTLVYESTDGEKTTDMAGCEIKGNQMILVYVRNHLPFSITYTKVQ